MLVRCPRLATPHLYDLPGALQEIRRHLETPSADRVRAVLVEHAQDELSDYNHRRRAPLELPKIRTPRVGLRAGVGEGDGYASAVRTVLRVAQEAGIHPADVERYVDELMWLMRSEAMTQVVSSGEVDSADIGQKLSMAQAEFEGCIAGRDIRFAFEGGRLKSVPRSTLAMLADVVALKASNALTSRDRTDLLKRVLRLEQEEDALVLNTGRSSIRLSRDGKVSVASKQPPTTWDSNVEPAELLLLIEALEQNAPTRAGELRREVFRRYLSKDRKSEFYGFLGNDGPCAPLLVQIGPDGVDIVPGAYRWKERPGMAAFALSAISHCHLYDNDREALVSRLGQILSFDGDKVILNDLRREGENRAATIDRDGRILTFHQGWNAPSGYTYVPRAWNPAPDDLIAALFAVYRSFLNAADRETTRRSLLADPERARLRTPAWPAEWPAAKAEIRCSDAMP